MPGKRHPTICCECGHEFPIGASISMQMGSNSGHATCPKCDTFLHISLNEHQTAAISEEWCAWLARVEPDTAEVYGNN